MARRDAPLEGVQPGQIRGLEEDGGPPGPVPRPPERPQGGLGVESESHRSCGVLADQPPADVAGGYDAGVVDECQGCLPVVRRGVVGEHAVVAGGVGGPHRPVGVADHPPGDAGPGQGLAERADLRPPVPVAGVPGQLRAGH